MKAIVLTCDRYKALTDHMIFKYGELWPEHPFTFLIPYQNERGRETNNRKYIESPVDIKGTILTLLSDLDDNEFVYWCIDDKYPEFIHAQKISSIIEWLPHCSPERISGILFCRARRMLSYNDSLRKEEEVDKRGERYLRRKNYNQIWIHQFLRVKVIRLLFESFPDRIENAKLMDGFKDGLDLPESHKIFVTEKNHAVFGESTSRGELTENCYKSILKSRLELPQMPSSNKNILIGKI